MKILRHVNKIFTSNTYLLYDGKEAGVWVIDPGDGDSILEWLAENEAFIKGIFITHAHFDHIYGINLLLNEFPELSVYCSVKAKDGLMSSKINGSYYTDSPFEIYNNAKMCCVEDDDVIRLWNDIHLTVLYTPGHNQDCVSFLVQNNLFTGDALIPGVKPYSRKIKGANELEATNSQRRLFDISSGNTIFCPGHGKQYIGLEIKSIVNFVPIESEKGFR